MEGGEEWRTISDEDTDTTKEGIPLAEYVPACNGEGFLVSMVAFKADVAAGVGVEYEHDRQRARPARARGAGGEEEGAGIIRWKKPDA